MMQREEAKKQDRYRQVAAILPAALRRAALALPPEKQRLAEEFRLRTGRAMTVLLPEGEWETETRVEPEDLETLCNLATEFSRYAAAETIREAVAAVLERENLDPGAVASCASIDLKASEPGLLAFCREAALPVR